jgi:sugar phosphate isomerase/epimerase
MIGLSTSWLTERADLTAPEIIEEIISLGFTSLELEYRISQPMFRKMHPLILRNDLKVQSLHNFFPFPPGLSSPTGSGDLFLLSSPDREERDQAITKTIQTIQTAETLGASAVVLHLGRVIMEPEYDRLQALFSRGLLRSPEGCTFLEGKLDERKEKRRPYLESVLHSLDRLNREAENHGVIIGIENRYYYHELPDFEEIGQILDRFAGGSVCYWHDVGHSHVQEKLGFLEPGSLLRAYRSRLAGIHLHDARGTDDHWAPGMGEIDFRALRESVLSVPIKILEVHKKSNRDQLIKGRDLLARIGLT